MTITKFTLTDKHLALLRNLTVETIDGKPHIDGKRLFGNSDIYDDINLILNGKTRDVNPTDTWEEEYSEELIVEWEGLIGELSTALDIILFTGSFEKGEYMRRTYNREWVKI